MTGWSLQAPKVASASDQPPKPFRWMLMLTGVVLLCATPTSVEVMPAAGPAAAVSVPS